MNLERLIEFKGVNHGLLLQIVAPFENFNDLLIGIRMKISAARDFFHGAHIVGVEGIILSEEQRVALFNLFTTKFGMTVSTLDSPSVQNFIFQNQQEEKEKEHNREERGVIQTPVVIDYSDYKTKIVRGVFRSGRTIDYDGNVVIVGDVNPGAEIRACGNIIVMGTLRGVAHAGKDGAEDAFVIASKMLPTQIRIADVSTRAPDGDESTLKTEIAYLKDGGVQIEEL